MVKPTVSMDVRGIPELNRRLRSGGLKVTRAASKAIGDSALYMEGKVKESIARGTNAPVTVDTGRYLGSIKGTKAELLASKVETNVGYAPHLEFGTSRMSARPHFKNTARREEQRVFKFILDAVRSVRV